MSGIGLAGALSPAHVTKPSARPATRRGCGWRRGNCSTGIARSTACTPHFTACLIARPGRGLNASRREKSAVLVCRPRCPSPIALMPITIISMMVVTAMPTVRVVTAVPVIDRSYADGIVCRYCRWQGPNWCSVRSCGNGGVSHSGDRDRTCYAYHERSSSRYSTQTGYSSPNELNLNGAA